MSDSEADVKAARLEPDLRDMKLDEEGAARAAAGDALRVKLEDADSLDQPPTPLAALPPHLKTHSRSQSPAVKRQDSEAPSTASSAHDIVGGDITLMAEPGKAPKLARAASRKVVSRPPPLYTDYPDAVETAKETFSILAECTYANKHLGTTDPALECDCQEEWDPVAKVNLACGSDSDCVNFHTKMECPRDCGCGRKCQNQRFTRKQYADVTVIKTEKKGFGLRANKDLLPGEFIFEYIGEVIDERTFRRRMIQYDEEGIKHFYFMSLTKGEFVDATKKGNLGRFCNHSCNPNCFVDKWVVGDKLRMGIFAERKVKAGEELVFNYNVDRYGADPQPCYCGEPNCTGYIGGKTQSENSTKLSHATIEALGIDDGEGWDTAVAKKPRKKKVSEDDEEYVNDLQPRSLEEDGVPKVMAALRQCTEKWIAVKLLTRIQQSESERVGHRIIRMHGYETLKKTITAWMDDFNVILQVLDILHNLPRITRNKIQDSKIEEAVEKLKACGDEKVETSASALLEAWSKLEVAYRIPRMKRDPNAGTAFNHFERRERGRERSVSPEIPMAAAPKGPSNSTTPSGPRGLNAPRGPSSFNHAPRPMPRPRPFNPLPAGWFQAASDNGATYYYNSTGVTQWQRPTQPVHQPPPPPPKTKSDTQLLQEIISSITANAPARNGSASNTPQPTKDESTEKKSKSEKWRSLPQEKQEKLYETTLSTHIMSVASHYRKKLEKEELKRLSKEVAKKLVRGDYKSGRVEDPTAKLTSKHEKTIKKYVKEFLDKAVKKKEEREKLKAQKRGTTSRSTETAPETPLGKPDDGASDDDMADLKMDDSAPASPAGSVSALKRKRENGVDGSTSPKKSRTDADQTPPAPPPPPPPPTEDMPVDVEIMDENLLAEDFSVPSLGEGDSALINGKGSLQAKDFPSPTQLATPSTNGSIELKAQHLNGRTHD